MKRMRRLGFSLALAMAFVASMSLSPAGAAPSSAPILFNAFIEEPSFSVGIGTVNPDTGVSTLITLDGDATDPAWSPDHSKIAFAMSVKNAQEEIFVMNADGSGLKRLTRSASDVRDLSPSWSPDGSRIAWNSATYEDHASANIFVMRVDGRDKRLLTDDARQDDEMSWEPSWSPDGARIAFTRGPPDGSPVGIDVYVMSALNGSGQINITNSPEANDLAPQWSPTSQSIAYVRISGRAPTQLMLTDVNSLASRVLLRDFEGLDFAWAPDGGAIAYSASMPSKPAEFVAEIFVVGLAGGPPRSITPGFEGPYTVAGGPDWSPDGSKIAFDVESCGEFSCLQDIFVVGSDGGGLRNVTNSQIEEFDPDW